MRPGAYREAVAALCAGTEAGLVELGSDGTWITVAFAGRRVDALAGDGTRRWAIVDAAELWLADGEGTWRLEAEAPGPPLTCLALTSTGPVVGSAEAHLYRLSDGRLDGLDTFEQAEGRAHWYTPWGGPPDTRSLSVDPDGTLFANVHVGGVLRSHDGGVTWRPTIDIHADVHQVLAGAAPDLILAASAEGLAVSDDAGISWRIDDEGLHDTYCRAVAATPTTVVVSASSGPRGHRSALYRGALLRAGAFQRCRAGLPEWFDGNVDTGCLVADGSVVAAAVPDGEVFISPDDGRTWSRAAIGLPPVRCLALA